MVNLKTYHLCADDLPHGDLYVKAKSKLDAIKHFRVYLVVLEDIEVEEDYDTEEEEGKVVEEH